MIGKAERGPVGDRGDPQARAAYLMAVGGAAYLVSKAITRSRVVAFADLGMEAIYEFDVQGHAGHRRGRCARQRRCTTRRPREWQARIGKIPVVDGRQHRARRVTPGDRSARPDCVNRGATRQTAIDEPGPRMKIVNRLRRHLSPLPAIPRRRSTCRRCGWACSPSSTC